MAERPPHRLVQPVRGGLALSALVACLWVLGWLALFAAALWGSLDDDGRGLLAKLLAPHAGLAFILAFALPIATAAVLRPLVRAWPVAARRLRDEVELVGHAEQRHRVEASGARALRELARAIDGLAGRHAALRIEVEGRIATAQARLAEETRRLGALMAQLPQGVVVTNREGRVVLFNPQAQALLGTAGAPLGLGRAIASLIDQGVLDHAGAQLEHKVQQGQAAPAAHFVTSIAAAATGDAPALLRVQMVPVGATAHGAEPAAERGEGHVFLVEDITRSVRELGRREALLQRLTEGTRAALGSLRAAAQALHQYAGMDAARRERFTAVVHEEAERLAQQLSAAQAETRGESTSAWPLEDMRCGDLVLALQASLGHEVALRFDGAGAASWVQADSHALVQLLAHVLRASVHEAAVREVRLRVSEVSRFVRLQFEWPGPALEPERLHAWEAAALTQGMQAGITLRELLDRQGATWWVPPAAAAGAPCAALCLQLAGASEPADPLRAAARGRPISYDFDLFSQPGQSAALDETPLTALSYTVFDTETTGLRPSEGDELIAIGAVRIVNARLLEGERFETLTCPRRPVRDSALAVHGISTERLQGEPPLEQVLPVFARFCEDTVLVAHNAAFDMRFLELARDRTGVRFDQPVLDTLLLSAVVHGAHGADEHHLEQIAARLGVPVSARHEALADAMLAARVFLRLLPLLAERGIRTLGDARAASMRTPQAREAF